MMPVNRTGGDKVRLDLPIKATAGKQLLASELMTRIRNKGFANSHGRLTQTGDWICLQLQVEAMEEALKSRPLRDLRTGFLESRAGTSDRFELLALTLLHGMERARLELPVELADSPDALERMQWRELAKILRREIGSTEEIRAWDERLVETDRYDALATHAMLTMQTWDSAHITEPEAGTENAGGENSRARTRFLAEFFRTELRQGLPSISADPMGYFVVGSGAPFPNPTQTAG